MATATPRIAAARIAGSPQTAAEPTSAPMRGTVWQSPWLLGLLGGLLFWASLPPLSLWPLAWVAATPLVLLARQQSLPGRRPYLVLWLCGCAFWLATVYWLTLPHWATAFGWLAISLYMAIYWPLFVGLVRVARHWKISVVLSAPVVWTGLELARGHIMTGFLMDALAHSQYRVPALIQVSDLAGAYGLSFLLVAVGASLARMLPWDGQRGAVWPVVPLVLLPAAAWGYGHWRLSQPLGEPGPKIALIQGSIDTTLKSDPRQSNKIFDEYFGLSVAARQAEPHLDLIVWPETMFRFPWFTFSSDFRPPAGALRTPQEVQQESRDALRYASGILQVPTLLGIDVLHQTPTREEHYNSAVLIDTAGRPQGRYDKCHRVVFGEYVPGASKVPLLYRLTPLPGGLNAGHEPTSLRVGQYRCAPNICFETAVPHLIRSQVAELGRHGQAPDVLVNLTNDGWFWGSAELEQHLACGVFRAVECRKPLVVAANTGLSAWIDSNGRIQALGERRHSQFLIAQPRLDSRESWYLRLGDWPAAACLACCGVLGVLGFVEQKNRFWLAAGCLVILAADAVTRLT